MKRNNSIALVICMIILQLQIQTIITYPTASQSGVGIAQTEKDRLLNYATQEYTELATMIVQETVKIFEKVLNQVGVTKDRDVEPHIRDIRNYMERSKNLPNKQGEEYTNEIFELFDIGANLTTKFDSTKPNAASDVVKMDTLLKRNGVDDLSTSFVSHFLRMINGLEQQVANYLKSLNSNDKRNEVKMINWQQRIGSEENVSNKIDLFVEFFHIYEQ